MSLDVGDVVREGAARTVERNGAVLIAAFVAIKLASVVTAHSLLRSGIEALARAAETTGTPAPDLAAIGGATPFALPVPFPAAAGITLAVALIAEATRIVAVRTFASDATDSVPTALRTRRIGRATINGFVGGLVVYALVLLGTALLIVPGVFLGLVFYFVRQEIAVEDKNAIDAMAGSWDLTGGHRVQLFGLALLVYLIEIAAALPSVLLGASDPAAATVASALVSAVTAVFGVAVVTRAYTRLRAERANRLGIEPDEEPAFDFDP